MILNRRNVARPLDVAPDQFAPCFFVERSTISGEHARVVDQVVDYGLGVRPVHLRGRDKVPERFGR
jgi:hypothetical protein